MICPNHSLHSVKQWFYLFLHYFRIHIIVVVFRTSQRDSLVMWQYVSPLFEIWWLEEKPRAAALLARPHTSHNPGAASIHVRINVLLQNSSYAQPKAKKSDKTLQYKVALLLCWYVAGPVYFHCSSTLILQITELMSSQKLSVCNWEVKTLINLTFSFNSENFISV